MLTLVRFLLGFMLVGTSIFLILLVLIQRGRGGGLAGALGGMGGQSAFGTKAGDLFTKITIGVATFWILLCILSINVLGTQQSMFSTTLGAAAPEAIEGLGTTEALPSEPVEGSSEPAADPAAKPVDGAEPGEPATASATSPAADATDAADAATPAAPADAPADKSADNPADKPAE
jgi:preprotein translocase subunit SecG